ncbi:PREDICTED: NKG2D ligand 1-like, partial [Elephantulus edwardii]|uniref:NKG2D ligand 1-like n=1 Tax=Elephantulus edwardii TaxID=28737 RepID=UPI0003F0AD69
MAPTHPTDFPSSAIGDPKTCTCIDGISRQLCGHRTPRALWPPVMGTEGRTLRVLLLLQLLGCSLETPPRKSCEGKVGWGSSRASSPRVYSGDMIQGCFPPPRTPDAPLETLEPPAPLPSCLRPVPASHPFRAALRLPGPGPRILSLCFSRPHGSHSLCYNFTIMLKSPPGRSWCEVQGQVDEEPFCHYDCGNLKMVNVSLLGKKINAMKEGEEQTQTLRDIGAELRQRVPGIELENYSPRAPVTLQARMCCQLEAGGDTTASWQLGFDGQIFLQFDPKTMKWTQVHPGGRRMKEAWEKDRGLSMFLKRTSEGDCRLWLRALGAHRKETLELT